MKTKFYLYPLIFISVVVFGLACKKSNDVIPGNYFKINKEGALVTYASATGSHRQVDNPAINVFTFTGQTGVETFEITIMTSGQLHTGSYTSLGCHEYYMGIELKQRINSSQYKTYTCSSSTSTFAFAGRVLSRMRFWRD